MEHIKKQMSVEHRNSSQCTVYEYATKNSQINIGVAQINGRYPYEGYAMNRECTEMGYVVEGTGKLATESETVHLSAGDVVLIPAGEKYYWEGNLTVVLPAAPSWKPEQHEHINETFLCETGETK